MQCDEMQMLMSGEIDGELSPEDSARLAAHLASCDGCRAEYESMKAVADAASSLNVAMPADEAWDSFLDNVYNRLERRLGWLLLVLGAAVGVGFGLYEVVTLPWASPLVKLLLAIPLAGLLVLFVSVLRQRLAIVSSDRYSNDVMR